MPVRPPMVNSTRKLSAYIMGVVSEMLPLYSVVSQLNTFTALGMATLKLIRLNSVFSSGLWPLANMWWPHTRKLKMAIAIELSAMNL